MENIEPHILKTIRTKIGKFFLNSGGLKNLTIFSTILGGSLQVLYLCTLSPVYLRFFSVTQMLSDSLVIAITIFTFLITPFLIISTLLSLRFSLRTDGLLFTIALLISTYIGMHISKYQQGDKAIIASFLFWSLVSIVTVILLYLIIKTPYTKHLEKFINKHGKEGLQKAYSITVLLLFICFILFIYASFTFIKNNSNTLKQQAFNTFVMSENFANTSNICDNVSKEKCAIKYFNDKYIFLERENKKIEVLKFEAFFQNSNK